MLSFKNNQNVQPLYDYYVETDLDSFDDQPVDYSKKYSDQDSYEDCRRTKSILKPNQFPSSEVSQTIKQSCNDEVKVYCIEGTPLTISSASSFCDLREVGASSVEKSNIKHSFPSVNDDESTESFEMDLKKSEKSPDSKKDDSPLSKEKDDAKEVKSVSFRSGDDISKASSPLMFSRSSSVASLNSFEQQSIVDDRSSVSAFSALTSGLISPSDLPDSPGEVMSPTLTDKDSSPKIDVTKMDSDNELDNIDLCAKDKIDSEEIVCNDTNNLASTHIQLPKAKEYIPMDDYKSERNSEEDNEILIQDLELSNNSVEIDEVFPNPDYENDSFTLHDERDLSEQLSKSDDDSDVDDILLQQCIQLGMPNNSTENKCEINACKKMEYQPHPQNIALSQVEIKKEIVSCDKESVPGEKDLAMKHHRELGMSEESFNKIGTDSAEACKSNLQSQCLNYPIRNVEMKNNDPVKSDDDSDEDDALLQRCIQLGMPENTPTKIVAGAEGFIKTRFSSHPVNYNSTNVEMKNNDPVKSDDDSDEDDALLQRCIQLGMPENTPTKIVAGAEGFNKTRYSSHPINYNSTNDLYGRTSAKSDDDDSDGDDILLQQCIQLGMPNKSSDNKVTSHVYKRMECSTLPLKTSSSQVHNTNEKIESNEPLHYSGNNAMPQPSMQYKMPYKLNDKIGVSVTPVRVVNYPSSTKNGTKSVPRKMYPIKTDGDSDGEENDMLLQHCIQMGMPKESCEKKRLHPRICREPEYESQNYSSSNDLRDNCPDGISDGDEEDDLLEKCIRAGMPSPKVNNNVQNRLHSLQTANISRKLQIPNRSFLPDPSVDSNKKFNSSRLPQNQPYAPIHSSTTWLSSTSFIDVDSMRIYQTEDTPILSPSASISDLSSLSFNESFLNNSRNSDCTSDSDDDELLQRCIRSGMPEAKRAVA